MAEVSSLFKISGRVGNTVFVRRAGKCYARSVALEVHNPNTLKQQLVRSRFRVASCFYQRFKNTLLGEVDIHLYGFFVSPTMEQVSDFQHLLL